MWLDFVIFPELSVEPRDSPDFFFFFLFIYLFIYLERDIDSVSWGAAEREREREGERERENPKQTHCQHRAQCRAQTHKTMRT